MVFGWRKARWAISLIFAPVGTTESAPSLGCTQSLPVIGGRSELLSTSYAEANTRTQSSFTEEGQPVIS